MSTPAATITSDRECDSCGYNLKGLPDGGNCPECGKPVRRKSIRGSGTMSDEAPTRFVRRLRTGFLLASAAILGAIVLRFFNLGFIASGLWVAGIWLITERRPRQGQIRPDKVLDSEKFRAVVRYASFAWPVYSLASAGLLALVAANAGSGVLVGLLSAVLILGGAAAWISLIPTSVYFAELSYWAAHENLSDRLRATAWTLAVFGTLGALLTVMAVAGGSSIAGFVGVPIFLVTLLAVFIFGITTIQLGSVMSWVIKHQSLSAGSAERVRQRVERESKAPGHIATELSCQECGYDLRGLAFGGSCPECGQSYADLTPMPVRDPARTRRGHDDSEIEIEQGESKGIYFNESLDARGKPKAGGAPYKPAIEVPDEGDIPLSMDDEEPPASEDEPGRPDRSAG